LGKNIAIAQRKSKRWLAGQGPDIEKGSEELGFFEHAVAYKWLSTTKSIINKDQSYAIR